MVFIERRAKRLIKQATAIGGVFLGFLGVFFAVSPQASVHEADHALLSGSTHMTVSSARVPLAYAETVSISDGGDGSVGSGDSGCGCGGGGSGGGDDS